MVHSYRLSTIPTFVLVLVIYLVGVNSFPTRILVGQIYDDALFIQLGRSIVNGHWLGSYNELTLFKAPMFPVFLAGVSLTGIPFNIAQHCLYFVACGYFASIAARFCKSRAIGLLLFAALLTCPSYYTTTRIVREPIYAALTLFTVGAWIELFLLGGVKEARPFFAAIVGALSGAYWLTREEGIWIVPCLGIISLGGLLKVDDGSAQMSKRAWNVCLHLIIIGLCASSVAVGIGMLNKMMYGRFVLIEMNDGDFQHAMTVLQRVGAPYERAYLALPFEARQVVYAESPSFAKLKDFLDPPDHRNPWNNTACRLLPTTCGDIGGGWFMWALRDAASKAGMHETPEKAAAFYRTLASEVETACETERLKCSAWLPPWCPQFRPRSGKKCQRGYSRPRGCFSIYVHLHRRTCSRVTSTALPTRCTCLSS